MSQATLERYCEFFEQLTLQSLDQIEQLFEPNAVFRDPFNHVQGHAPIRRIFEHLLNEYPRTRFEVSEQVLSDSVAYIRWTFAPDPEKPLLIEGVSRVEFGANGKVQEHRDFWDSASELFAQLPVTGPPTRWLLRQAQACREDKKH